MSAPKWVIAGNSQQYMDWLRIYNHNRMEYRYVDSVDAIRGYRDPHGIFIGTYYTRPDIKQIMLQLQVATTGTNPAFDKAWERINAAL